MSVFLCPSCGVLVQHLERGEAPAGQHNRLHVAVAAVMNINRPDTGGTIAIHSDDDVRGDDFARLGALLDARACDFLKPDGTVDEPSHRLALLMARERLAETGDVEA